MKLNATWIVAVLLLAANLAAADAQEKKKPANSPSGPGPAAWTGDLAPISPLDWNYARAAHLLERAGFGGTPEEIERLAKMAPEQAVSFLVDYQLIDNPTLLAQRHYQMARQAGKSAEIRAFLGDALFARSVSWCISCDSA